MTQPCSGTYAKFKHTRNKGTCQQHNLKATKANKNQPAQKQTRKVEMKAKARNGRQGSN